MRIHVALRSKNSSLCVDTTSCVDTLSIFEFHVSTSRENVLTLLHCMNLLVLCVDTLSVSGFHMSTLQEHVSTPPVMFEATGYMCRHFKNMC